MNTTKYIIVNYIDAASIVLGHAVGQPELGRVIGYGWGAIHELYNSSKQINPDWSTGQKLNYLGKSVALREIRNGGVDVILGGSPEWVHEYAKENSIAPEYYDKVEKGFAITATILSTAGLELSNAAHRKKQKNNPFNKTSEI